MFLEFRPNMDFLEAIWLQNSDNLWIPLLIFMLMFVFDKKYSIWRRKSSRIRLQMENFILIRETSREFIALVDASV